MGSPKKGSETFCKYGRDYLLQLRMHPLSLQKPQNLPNMEIVKDRLYLHQIDNLASPGGDESQYHYYTDDIRTFMKHDNVYKRFSQRSSPGYTSRNCPEYASYQKYNAPLSISKYRTACYVPSPHKQHYRTSAYKSDLSTEDFLENISDFHTAPWYKETLYTNESEWNMSNKHSENKLPSSNNGCSTKIKKKLSIIDPKTGKNILEGIETSSTSQSSISSKETPEDEPKVTLNDGANSAINNDCKDLTHNSAIEDGYSFLKESSKQPSVLSYNPDSSDDEFMKEYSEYKRTVSENNNTSQRPQYEGNDKIVLKTFDVSPSDKEYIGGNISQSDDKVEETNVQQLKANVSRNGVTENEENVIEDSQDTNLKEKIYMLRDKVYSMKQEQQKMAILQSFLRFKKQQLDESFRSLDDKKMDIINLEYNLYTKAKNLHDKEYWIDAKVRNLKKREKQLEDKEKWLEMKEKEIRIKYNNVLKREKMNNDVASSIENGEFHGDRMDSCASNAEIDDNHDISIKDRQILPQKSKDYSSGDICEPSQQLRINDYSTNLNYSRTSKKAINSEGRKYIQDHVKQWFSQRDKSAKNDKESKP